MSMMWNILQLLLIVTSLGYDVGGKVLKSEPTNITVMQGDDLLLRCNSYNEFATDTSWQFIRRNTGYPELLFADDKSFHRNQRLELRTDEEYSILLRNANVTDEGTYTCTLYSDKTTMKSSIYVIVHAPVVLLDRESTSILYVNEGDDVNMTCLARGKPRPTITWRFIMPSVGMEKSSGSVFVLRNAGRDDAGKYVCTADNGISSVATRTWKLIVRFAPTAETDATSGSKVHFTSGSPTTIACAFSGEPRPEIMWLLPDGKKMSGNARSRDARATSKKSACHVMQSWLVIGAGRGAGDYACVASNSVGTASVNFTVTLVRD